MNRVRQGHLWMLSLLACAAAPVAPAAQVAPAVNVLSAATVSDLHYGDVLFHYYAGNEFESLTRLNAYEHWGRLSAQSANAALLAGGLYLQFGLAGEADGRFATLLAPNVPEGMRNPAWYYVASDQYARGDCAKAAQALGNINGALTPQLEARRQHLLINILIRQERLAEAVTRLHEWRGPADWMAYVRFNLGVALARQNRLQEAAPILGDVGTLATDDPELIALRDKANLALGYAWLQASNPYAARNALNRVRLNGPYATRALLGVGWANSAIPDHKAALTPWLELRDRDPLDAAVQESYLTVPYAFARLGANAQAAEYYEAAISAFGAESVRIDEAVRRIGSGHLLEDLLGNERPGASGIQRQLATLRDAPRYRYLYTLLADDEFEAGLRNYRELTWFDHALDPWSDNPETPGEGGGREHATAKPGPQERAQWTRLQTLDAVLQAGPPEPEVDANRAKLQLVTDAMRWKLDASLQEREYTARSELHAIDTALNETHNRWARLERARDAATQATGDFAARLASLNQRLTELHAAIAAARQRQDLQLAQRAQEQLLAQRDRLHGHELQARFALADLYDRAIPAAPVAGQAATNEPEPEPAAAIGAVRQP